MRVVRGDGDADDGERVDGHGWLTASPWILADGAVADVNGRCSAMVPLPVLWRYIAGAAHFIFSRQCWARTCCACTHDIARFCGRALLALPRAAALCGDATMGYRSLSLHAFPAPLLGGETSLLSPLALRQLYGCNDVTCAAPYCWPKPFRNEQYGI